MKGKKILKIIFDILIWIIIITSTLITLSTLNSRQRGIPNLLGYVPLNIQSESMEPEIMKGDLIIAREYNPNTMILNEGDVISFISEIDNQRVIITHRIEHIISINQMVSYITKGDNNSICDENQVASGDIVALWSGIRVPLLGMVCTFLKTKVGFISCVILPLGLYFVYQLYQFIMLLFEYRDIK